MYVSRRAMPSRTADAIRYPASSRGLLWSACVLMFVAVLLGGQASANPAREMLIQLVALICAFFALRVPSQPGDRLNTTAKWTIFAMIVLVVLHLIPLPYEIWRAITPVDTAAEILEGFGLANGWRSFIVVPHETQAKLLLLIPPVTMYFVTLRLDPASRIRLVLATVALSVFSSLLGLMQFASGTDNL